MYIRNTRSGSAFFVALAIIVNMLLPAVAQTPTEAKKSPVDQNKIALLAGISNYPDGSNLNKIDGCVNNVPLLAGALADYGFEDANVMRLIDKQATHEAIVQSFRTQLIERARTIKAKNSEAVVVFYFCGHGSQYPDQDGDEADGLDETLVAYDSRSSKSFDILDDEIDDLKAELRQYTTNVTIILESCHSGTGSRGGEEFISEQADDDTRARPPYKRKFPPSGDADAFTYAEIDASLSNRSAKSESSAGCNCDKPYSLMTKALVQAMKRATPATTYRGLVSEVADEVSRFSQQEPQSEGNRDTLLFGGAARRTRAYIAVSDVHTDGTVVIDAGKAHGLKEGSQVAFYSVASATNTGKDGWLANGVVTTVGTGNSVVSVPKIEGKPVAAIDKRSHAVLASPVFGGGSVLVSLAPEAARTALSNDGAIRTEVEKRLRDDNLIDNQVIDLAKNSVISPNERSAAKSVIRLRRDKVGNIFNDNLLIRPIKDAKSCVGQMIKSLSEAERIPSKDADVYFLDDGTTGGSPLFGYTFDPASTTVAKDIADAIRSTALQQNLRGLNNTASTLASNIDVSFETGPADSITTVCSAIGVLERKADNQKLREFRKSNTLAVPLGSIARLQLRNISGVIRKKTDPYASGESLFVTVLAINTKGEIQVFDNSNGGQDMLADGNSRVIYIGGDPPIGVEHYIVVVSRQYADFSFYRSWKSIERGGPVTPLQRLLMQSGTATRGSKTVVDEPDSWGVIRLDINITKPAAKTH